MAVKVHRKLPTEKSALRIYESIKHDCRYTIGALLKVDELRKNNKIRLNIKDEPLLAGFISQYKRTGELKKSQLASCAKSLPKYYQIFAEHGGVTPANLPQTSKYFITDKEDRIAIRFVPDDMYGHVIKTIKTLHNYRWVPTKKYWTLPNNAYNLEVLFQTGVRWKVSDQVYKKYKAETKKRTEVSVKGLNMTLREYQKDALKFIAAKGGRALVGDQMGLGKTPTSIAYTVIHKLYPAVVICPANLKLNWKKEIERWVSDKVNIEVLNGMTPSPINQYADFIIVNYDIIYHWADEILKANPMITIVDEIQYIKTSETYQKVKTRDGRSVSKKVPVKRTAGTVKVGKKTPFFIGLSGTPIENRVIEFFNTLNLIRHDYFPSIWKFATRYADLKPNFNGPGWDMSGRSNIRELHSTLSKLIMIRRKKSDVMKELPEISRVLVPVEMSKKGREEYQKAENEFLSYIMEKYKNISIDKLLKKNNVLTKIASLRQLCIKGKKEECINWISDRLFDLDKLIVFTYHRETVTDIQSHFKNSLFIVGGMNSKDKDDTVTKFQSCKVCGVMHHYHAHDEKACEEFVPDDKYPLLTANISAAAEGLNLTAASNAGMLEYPYNPAKLQQAEARLHRSGQTESVVIWYLVASGTIEEVIMSNIDEKMKTVEEVIDGKDGKGLMDSMLSKDIMKNLINGAKK